MSNYHVPTDPHFAHLPPPPRPHAVALGGFVPPSPQAPPSQPAQPLGPPSGTAQRRVEVDIRNLVLALGVLSLVAASVSLVAMNWESFDSSMRASLLVGVTALSLVAGLVTTRRDLSGTATALSWLTMVLIWVDLFAIERAAFTDVGGDGFTAIGGAVLFGVFLGLGLVQPGAAMRTGATVAWLLGWWSAFVAWDVTGADVWVLPIAAVVGWFQIRHFAGRPDVGSWNRCGAALIIAATPAVLTALEDPGMVRPMIVIGAAMAVLLVGLWLRQLAAVWVAGVSLGVLAGAQLIDALRGIPGWAIFALVGVVLLGVGAGFEYRLRGRADDDTAQPTDGPTEQPLPSSSDGWPGRF